MKRFLALFLSLVMLLSGVAVNGAMLDFLKTPMNNFMSTGEFSLHVKNADKIYEHVFGIDSDRYVGIWNYNMLFKSLLTSNGTVSVKSDVSDDYKCMKMQFGSGLKYDIDVNDLLSACVDVNFELWVDMDITDIQNPKFDVIVASPFREEYFYADLIEILGKDESVKLAFLLALTYSTDKELVSKLNTFSLESLEKYADVTEENGTYTLKLDNDGLFKYLDAVLNYSYSEFSSLFVYGQTKNLPINLSLKDLGLNVLGENGITMVYVTENGKPTQTSVTADICIDLRDVCELIGEKYPLDEDLLIEAELSQKLDYTEFGTAKIEIPEITKENSISVADRINPPMYEIPRSYVYLYHENVLNTDEYYFPFDMIMRQAFEDNAKVTITDGFVVAESEYFNGYKTLKFKCGESSVYVDDVAREAGKTWFHDGTVYVGKDFVENILGWQIIEYEENFLTDEISFGLDTRPHNEEGFGDNDNKPRYRVVVEFCGMPKVEDRLYVPLRDTLEMAYYGKNITFDYVKDSADKDGVVTVTNKYFPGFETVKMKVGDKSVYVDGKAFEVGEIVLNDGVTYVPEKFFNDVFGWETDSVTHEIISDDYTYVFITQVPEVTEPRAFDYVYLSLDEIPETEDKDVIYLPFGETMRRAYGDRIVAQMKDGVVTLSGKNSPNISLNTVNNTISVDGTEYKVKTLVQNGEAFVPAETFTDVFGWTFYHAEHDILNEIYEFTFYTSDEESVDEFYD